MGTFFRFLIMTTSMRSGSLVSWYSGAVLKNIPILVKFELDGFRKGCQEVWASSRSWAVSFSMFPA
ncbi:MAG: hypothetical protein LBI91_07685 [Spirochaetaceae bacterium]|nr:hypothetical protein [Spirochaetaceae bacterium]